MYDYDIILKRSGEREHLEVLMAYTTLQNLCIMSYNWRRINHLVEKSTMTEPKIELVMQERSLIKKLIHSMMKKMLGYIRAVSIKKVLRIFTKAKKITGSMNAVLCKHMINRLKE